MSRTLQNGSQQNLTENQQKAFDGYFLEKRMFRGTTKKNTLSAFRGINQERANCTPEDKEKLAQLLDLEERWFEILEYKR